MRIIDCLILDGCVLLNLLATGLVEQILKCAAKSALICVLIETENFYLRNEADVT